jgi:hypothetical protein
MLARAPSQPHLPRKTASARFCHPERSRGICSCAVPASTAKEKRKTFLCHPERSRGICSCLLPSGTLWRPKSHRSRSSVEGTGNCRSLGCARDDKAGGCAFSWMAVTRTKRAVALFPGWPLLGQSGRWRFFLDGRYSDKAGGGAFSWMAVAWTKRAVALFPGWPLLGQCNVFVLINKSNHQNPSTG